MRPAGRTGLVLRKTDWIPRPAGAGSSSGFFLLAGSARWRGRGVDASGGSVRGDGLRRTGAGADPLRPPARPRRLHHGHAARDTSPTRRGSSGRRTPTSSPCPTASPPPTPPRLRASPARTRSSSTSPATCACPRAASLPRRGTGTIIPRPRSWARRPTASPSSTAKRSAPRVSSAIRAATRRRCCCPCIPLVRERLIDADDVIVDAKSGTTGAGRAPREDLLFSEVADDFSAYAPGRVHRHVGEMEAVGAREGRPRGAPHLLPAPAARCGAASCPLST